MIINSDAFKKYKQSYRRIIVLYNGIISSFKKSHDQLADSVYKKTDIEPKDPIYLYNNNEESYLIAGNAYELLGSYKNRYLNNLNEILLIRCISMVENYLIDILKELFLVRKDLFHTDRVFEFSQRELLHYNTISEVWTKIINKESRDLQNQGFIEIKKYYKKNIGIDFNSLFSDIGIVEKIHDIRHLLVHRLGFTDQQYRKKYSVTEKNIKIDEVMFREYLALLNEFINTIEIEIVNLMNEIVSSSENVVKKSYEFIIKDESISHIFDPNYSFYVNEIMIKLSDITKTNLILSNKVTLQFLDKPEYVKPYLKTIKKYEKRSMLNILTTIQKSDFRKRKISTEQIDTVRKELPEKPYPVDIHKTIATKLGWRNNLVFDIITVILEEDS